jgi:hypothetical protein
LDPGRRAATGPGREFVSRPNLFQWEMLRPDGRNPSVSKQGRRSTSGFNSTISHQFQCIRMRLAESDCLCHSPSSP